MKFGWLLLLIVIVVSLANVLSLSNSAKVVVLGSSNQSNRSTSIYAKTASQDLQRSIWNRNKITFNTGQLRQQLLNQFPELTQVSVTLPLLTHQPIVYIEPARPALILVTANAAFLVGDSGKALLSAVQPSGLNQSDLPLVNDQSGLLVKLNHQALSASSVQFIQVITGQLTAKHYTVSTMTLPAASSEFDVRLNGQPYLLKFNLRGDARGQVGTFLATIAELHHKNIMPTNYIDIRVDGRAYYK